MASFIIREIDDAVWKKVKSKAALEGVTLKDLVVGWIESYAKEPAHPRKR